MGSWMTVRGAMVTSKVIAATNFCDICVIVIMLPPLTLKRNATSLISPSIYVTDLASATENLSSHNTMDRMMRSSNLLDESPPSNYINSEPLISHGHSISVEEVHQGGEGVFETSGDFPTQGLWKIHIDAIIEVIFEDSVADTYRKEPLRNLLALWENKKER